MWVCFYLGPRPILGRSRMENSPQWRKWKELSCTLRCSTSLIMASTFAWQRMASGTARRSTFSGCKVHTGRVRACVLGMDGLLDHNLYSFTLHLFLLSCVVCCLYFHLFFFWFLFSLLFFCHFAFSHPTVTSFLPLPLLANWTALLHCGPSL